ncbi:MAG: hypothetical protein QXO21_02720, partial [Candidatus Anstonellales archaeon]
PQKLQKGETLLITATATSNSQPISGITINFIIRNVSNTAKYATVCTTTNGMCYIDYQISSNIKTSEFGFWSIAASSSPQVFLPTSTISTFQVVDCEKSSNCQCYEYCGTDYRCVDFRPSLLKCSYYDACSGQNCYSNGQLDPTKCYNADPRICEDQQSLCHGWFIRCGEERVEK